MAQRWGSPLAPRWAKQSATQSGLLMVQLKVLLKAPRLVLSMVLMWESPRVMMKGWPMVQPTGLLRERLWVRPTGLLLGTQSALQLG